MMGVYITGIDLPTKGNPITVTIYPDGTAEWEAQHKTGCAIPVPPHGGLIDADALCEGRVSNDNVVICAKCAPTIIPAEEGE